MQNFEHMFKELLAKSVYIRSTCRGCGECKDLSPYKKVYVIKYLNDSYNLKEIGVGLVCFHIYQYIIFSFPDMVQKGVPSHLPLDPPWCAAIRSVHIII